MKHYPNDNNSDNEKDPQTFEERLREKLNHIHDKLDRDGEFDDLKNLNQHGDKPADGDNDADNKRDWGK